jgi:ferric-dicitrate binding protein FerR (iron transport regulator)
MSRWLKLVSVWPFLAACTGIASAQWPNWGGADSVAKVTSLTGQVSVLKDGQPWALNVGSTVQVKQTIVSGADGFAVLQVSDGSTFEVYPNSRVTFRNNPANLRDLLDVWLGRVRVHIQKLGGRPNHNRITSPTAVISVRGTIFDVAVEEDGDATLVAVEEGEVAVQHAILPVGEPKIVKGGEYIRVYRTQPLAQKSLDKGGVLRQVLRAAGDAVIEAMSRTPRGGGAGPTVPSGGAGGGPTIPGGTSGDSSAGEPPPPPPPAPPPPQ